MSDSLAGLAAVITGAGSGIGRAVAERLAADGVRLVLHDRDRDGVQAVADSIGAAGGAALALTGDVREPDSLKRAVEAAVGAYGGLHLAVNNAGIGGPRGPLADYDDSDGFAAYRDLMAINLDAVYVGMRYEIPAIIAAGGGAIVNISSVLGLVSEPNAAPYTAAKHGVAGLTKAAAVAYAARGVRINSVHPGYIDTPLLAAATPEMRQAIAARHPIGRLGTAAEVAHLVVFLLSAKASFITGSQHVVDGGYTAV